jgi:hypothetical protein
LRRLVYAVNFSKADLAQWAGVLSRCPLLDAIPAENVVASLPIQLGLLIPGGHFEANRAWFGSVVTTLLGFGGARLLPWTRVN